MAANDVPPPPEGFAVEEVFPPPPDGFAVEDTGGGAQSSDARTGINLPPFDVNRIKVRSSGPPLPDVENARIQWRTAFENGASKNQLMVLARKLGLPLPVGSDLDAMIAERDAQSGPPAPTAEIKPGDYEFGMDRVLDFSPPSQAMTNIQQRQYLEMLNDPRYDRAQVTAFLNGIGRQMTDSMWQEVEASRSKGVPFGAVASPDERFEGMVDEAAIAQEYAPVRDDFFAQVGRSAVEAWSYPSSLMNAIDRAKQDYLDLHLAKLRERFPDASPEEMARLEEDYIAYLSRMRSEGATEAVKNDSVAPWLLGQFVAVEPYDALMIGRGATATTRAGRALEKATEAAMIATAGDVAGQSLAIKDGARDKYNPAQTFGSAALSGVIGGGFGAMTRKPTVGVPEGTLDGAPAPSGAAPEAPEAPKQTLGRELAAANDGGAPVPRPRPLLEPTSRAELLASASRVQPRDPLPIPANTVDGPDVANIGKGRFAEAKPVNERGALIRGTVTNWRGEKVPKVGPLDLVGWLRSQGGLREQGGELATMGLTNAQRRGLDHVGQETRFGPLVDPDGMTIDDAALGAWEAGYFPELRERPDINSFLDALRETYNGGAGRRFLPEDMAQIETFDAMRAERYDLEQLRFENDGPILTDRSIPAGDERPFPPVEAYEEWPAEAVGRIGNLDVSKLETPQDIGRALRQSYNTLGGFDAATRGRIANAETERLAAELNMTPEQLLSRRKGQAFNAEEALAARQILAKSANELVNAARQISRVDDPGDELLVAFRQKWMRHVAIQEQVAGITAEAGRVLNQFKMAASSRAVRRDVLTAFVRGGGGKDDLQDAANALLDAVERGPGAFNTLSAQAAKPKFRDKISELYINSLLSNPPTHIVNMVSNSLTMVSQIPEHAFASALGGARRAVLGEKAGERILASEVGARAFGLLQGTREGAAQFVRALRTGEPDDFASKVEGDQYKAISGLKGEVVRLPTRFLTAEDQLFKGIARRMELNAEAVRIAHREGATGAARKERIAELVANPTDDMLARSLDYGRYLTFQRPLGAFGQGLTRITLDNFAAKVVVPFVRTPINLLKFAVERSPAAPILKEWRADFKAGGERRDLAISRALIGTGFATLFYQMALDGQITGSVPPDPAKAKLLYADGWQPYSLKVGDRYVSYSRLDPFATLLGVSADMATLPQGLSDRQKEDQGTMLVASIMGNLANKTWLSGVSSLVEGLSDPGRYADNWLQRTIGAFAVPAGVAGAARAIDPVARKRESVLDAVLARIPGLSDNLLSRRDVFGEPVKLDNLGPDFLSPFAQTEARNDPVVAEMMRIGKSVSAPGKQYTQDGEKLDYTPEQYDRYHEIAGRLSYNRLLALIGSPQYARLDDAARQKASAKAIADARRDAREVLSDPSYPIPARGEVEAMGAPTSGALPTLEREASDSLSLLEANIPGVRVTSGYRDAQYQDDMRRRGYTPAKNSAHLRGDGIDLLPPEGLSMKALAVKVRKVLPQAKILNESDHLHVTIPGWGKAPVLGGADRASVVNPALVPPPPDGFQLEQ